MDIVKQFLSPNTADDKEKQIKNFQLSNRKKYEK